MLDERTALSEFRHRVANDLALVLAAVDRRRRQLHVLSPGEVLDEVTNAVANLALLYRHLHDRPCGDNLVDVGQHLASVGARIDASYLSPLGITLIIKAPAAVGPSSLAHDLALIMLELVANAARHGEAQRIGVELSVADEVWSCCVADDGIGLPAAFSAPSGGGLYYVGRLAAGLKGQLTIASAPQQGTSLRVCFPSPGFCTRGAPPE